MRDGGTVALVSRHGWSDHCRFLERSLVGDTLVPELNLQTARHSAGTRPTLWQNEFQCRQIRLARGRRGNGQAMFDLFRGRKKDDNGMVDIVSRKKRHIGGRMLCGFLRTRAQIQRQGQTVVFQRWFMGYYSWRNLGAVFGRTTTRNECARACGCRCHVMEWQQMQ